MAYEYNNINIEWLRQNKAMYIELNRSYNIYDSTLHIYVDITSLYYKMWFVFVFRTPHCTAHCFDCCLELLLVAFCCCFFYIFRQFYMIICIGETPLGAWRKISQCLIFINSYFVMLWWIPLIRHLRIGMICFHLNRQRVERYYTVLTSRI